MGDNVNLDKYERLISERKEKLKFLSDRIKIFDAESFAIGKSEEKKENLPNKDPPLVPKSHKFIVPSKISAFLPQWSPETHFLTKSPENDEKPPQKGHVSNIVRKLEKLSAPDNVMEVPNYDNIVNRNLLFEKNSKSSEKTDPSFVSEETRDPPTETQSPPGTDNSECGSCEIDYESDQGDLEEYNVDCYGTTGEAMGETSLQETKQLSPKNTYETSASIKVTEFAMGDVPFQRMSTTYDCDHKLPHSLPLRPDSAEFTAFSNELDKNQKIKSKRDFSRLYPTSADLMRDLMQRSKDSNCMSSVVLNTVKSESSLTEVDLKKSLLLEENIIQQVSKALSIFSSNNEFIHSSVNVECSRLLLIAKTRRAGILNEISTLKEKAPTKNKFVFNIKLDGIRLQLKRSFLSKGVSLDECYYFMVILKSGHRVLASELRSSLDFVGHSSVDFVDVFELFNLPLDFSVSLEIHYLDMPTQHEGGNFLRKLTHTPIKIKKKSKVPVLAKPFIALCPFVFSAEDNGRRIVQISPIPSSCVIDGVVRLNFECLIDSKTVIRCFLTFRETSTWERRWCLFSNGILKMWSYPDDESNGRVPVRRIDLIRGLCGTVNVCGQCARPFAFELSLREGDVVRVCLVAADTEEEMNEVIDYFSCLHTAVARSMRR